MQSAVVLGLRGLQQVWPWDDKELLLLLVETGDTVMKTNKGEKFTHCPILAVMFFIKLFISPESEF